MFSLMNSWEVTEPNENFKKLHFRREGFNTVLEAYYVYRYWTIFKFVKILNHSLAQVLSNKKNRSFLRLLWAEIFLQQFCKFLHTWAVFCAPTVNLWHFKSMYKGSNHTSKTVFDLNINLLCPREESLQFFYSNLSFSNFL